MREASGVRNLDLRACHAPCPPDRATHAAIYFHAIAPVNAGWPQA